MIDAIYVIIFFGKIVGIVIVEVSNIELNMLQEKTLSLAQFKILQKSFEIMKTEDLQKLRDTLIREQSTVQLKLDMVEKELNQRKKEVLQH